MAGEELHIRSFRVVFDLDRRIHRIDRYRVPLPYGLPVSSLGYATVALIGIALLSHLPLTGPVISALPAPLRYVLIPVGAAYALTRLRIDGRSAHAAVFAWLGHALGPRRFSGFRPLPAQPSQVLGDVAFARPRLVASKSTRPRSGGDHLSIDGTEQLVLW